MLRDATELRQPLTKETVAVLASVCVSVTDDVGVGVGDGQMAVHPLHLLDVLIDRVAVRTEDDASVAVLGDVLVSVLQILTGRSWVDNRVTLAVNTRHRLAEPGETETLEASLTRWKEHSVLHKAA